MTLPLYPFVLILMVKLNQLAELGDARWAVTELSLLSDWAECDLDFTLFFYHPLFSL